MGVEVVVTSVQTLEGIQLLMVDDEPGVLRALSLLLTGYKCRVTALSSPTLLLEHIQSGSKPDVILSDLRMPEMSGLELLASLKAQGCATPFLLMSGHASPSELAEARLAGVTAFLSKPFLPQDLITMLSKVCPQVADKRRAAG